MAAGTTFLGDLAPILIGVVAIAALIFCISICAEEAPGVSGFLTRQRSEADRLRSPHARPGEREIELSLVGDDEEDRAKRPR